MKKSFMEQLYEKGEKAQKKGAVCFKSADFQGYLENWIEGEYFMALGLAANGMDHERSKDTVVDHMRRGLTIGTDGRSRPFQSLKKLGKTEKTQALQEAINAFIDELSPDLLTLAKKSTEIENTLKGMSTWERMEKKLTNNVDNPVSPEDRLMIADAAIMAILNKRKAQSNVTRFVKTVREILK